MNGISGQAILTYRPDESEALLADLDAFMRRLAQHLAGGSGSQ